MTVSHSLKLGLFFLLTAIFFGRYQNKDGWLVCLSLLLICFCAPFRFPINARQNQLRLKLSLAKRAIIILLMCKVFSMFSKQWIKILQLVLL